MGRFARRMLWCSLLAILLATPVNGGRAATREHTTLDAAERATLLRYARDTWRSFEAMATPGGLPVDGLHRSADGTWVASTNTGPTDIAAYLWSTLAAEALALVTHEEAERRLGETLEALRQADRVHGFLFDQLDPRTGAALEALKDGKQPIRAKLSVVDNGWLAAALIMVANTRPALKERADALLKPMDFRFFYVPYDPHDPGAHPGQLHGVYRPADSSFDDFFHGLLNTEPRIVTYIGIARGQLPPDHYYRINRTLRPAPGVEQKQTPHGESRTYLGVEVFEGHYRYQGMRIVPSWGGSMFEALMVPLFVPEARWAPRSWGINHPLYVRAQIAHGLDEAHYGFWGFSPACRPEGGYQTYGVPALGTNPRGYTSQDGPAPSESRNQAADRSPAGGVVTPHASFLALPFSPHEALANLQALAGKFPIYGQYGFRDSVNVSTGAIADCELALDQGMIMAAIANALAGDVLQHAFADGPIEAAIRPLIACEEFTAGTTSTQASDGERGDAKTREPGPGSSQ